jgi:ABC-2 type transport system permease protein
MIGDIVSVARKEWLEYLQPEATRRLRPLRIFAFVVAGGAFVGWQMDPDFGRSWLTVFLVSFLSMMFVTGVVPDSVAGERERHTLETLLATRLPDQAIVLGKVFAAVSYGFATGCAVLPAGVVAANLFHGSEGEPWIRPVVVLVALVSAILTGLAIASLGVLLSLYAPTSRQANQRLGFAMMGFVFLPAIAISAIPAAMRTRIAVSVGQLGLFTVVVATYAFLVLLACGLLVAAVTRFRRTRLIF